MTATFRPHLLAAESADGRALWLTIDDRWTDDLNEAEILDDEAHATIRLIEGQILSRQGQTVRLVELQASADFA